MESFERQIGGGNDLRAKSRDYVLAKRSRVDEPGRESAQGHVERTGSRRNGKPAKPPVKKN